MIMSSGTINNASQIQTTGCVSPSINNGSAVQEYNNGTYEYNGVALTTNGEHYNGETEELGGRCRDSLSPPVNGTISDSNGHQPLLSTPPGGINNTPNNINNINNGGGGKVTTNVPPSDPSNGAGVQQKDTTFTKIFVGGLPYHTTDDSLRKFFLVYGDIEEAVVITDRQTGKSRGYGFVTMSERGSAERAVKEANPIIDGRKANVNLAYIGAKPRSNSIYGSLYLNGVTNGASNATNLNGVNLPLNTLYTGLFPVPNGLQQIIYNPLSTQLLGSPYLSTSPNTYSPLISQQIGAHQQPQQSLINALVNQGNLGSLINPSRLNGHSGNGANGPLSPNGLNFIHSPHSAPNHNSHHLVIPYDYAHLNGINSINFLGSPNGIYSMGNEGPTNLGIGLHHLNPIESEHLMNSGNAASLQHGNGGGSLLLTPPPGTYINGSHGSANYMGIGNGALRSPSDPNHMNAHHHRTNHINFPS